MRATARAIATRGSHDGTEALDVRHEHCCRHEQNRRGTARPRDGHAHRSRCVNSSPTNFVFVFLILLQYLGKKQSKRTGGPAARQRSLRAKAAIDDCARQTKGPEPTQRDQGPTPIARSSRARKHGDRPPSLLGHPQGAALLWRSAPRACGPGNMATAATRPVRECADGCHAREQNKRLRREAQCLELVEDDGVWVDSSACDGTWIATMRGPEGTPYAGGSFGVEVAIPAAYPFSAPGFRFTTRIWHPCVDPRTGEFCFDRGEWSPALTIEKMLIIVRSKLSETPESLACDSRHAPEWYIADLNTQVARQWTQQYASLADRWLAFAMVGHQRLGRDTLWAQAAIDDCIIRMVCQQLVLLSRPSLHAAADSGGRAAEVRTDVQMGVQGEGAAAGPASG